MCTNVSPWWNQHFFNACHHARLSNNTIYSIYTIYTYPYIYIKPQNTQHTQSYDMCKTTAHVLNPHDQNGTTELDMWMFWFKMKKFQTSRLSPALFTAVVVSGSLVTTGGKWHWDGSQTAWLLFSRRFKTVFFYIGFQTFIPCSNRFLRYFASAWQGTTWIVQKNACKLYHREQHLLI